MLRQRIQSLLNAPIFGPGEMLYRYRRWWPWLTLGLYFLIIVFSSYQLLRYVEQKDHQAVEMKTVELAASIEQRMNSTEALLRSAANGFSFVPLIDRDFFYSFIKGLSVDERAHGIVGIGWTVPVKREQLSSFEAMMRESSQKNFYVWPVTDERLSYAITFLAPDSASNQAALGYNMFSNPQRRLAMIQAFDSGSPRATAPVALKQKGLERDMIGFLVYAPVFDGAHRRTSMAAPDRDRFRGFIYAAVRGADLLRAVSGTREHNLLDLELYDITDGNRILIHDTHPELWSDENPTKATANLKVGERKLQLVAAPVYANEFRDTSQRVMIYALLIVGSSSVMLLAILMWRVVRSMEQSRRALDRQIEQVEIRSILLRELNHRVKNTLATVHSLAALSRHNAADIDSYFTAFSGRLRALSATHDLLTQSDWGPTELQDIAEAELSPFYSSPGQVLIKGPRVMFDPTKALSLGLSLHELATNASKYGALSSTQGRVTLFWYLEDDNTLSIIWTETGGPPVSSDRKQGFGSTLIEKLMARQLKAEVTLSLEPSGAICKFRMKYEPAPEQERMMQRFRRNRNAVGKRAKRRGG